MDEKSGIEQGRALARRKREERPDPFAVFKPIGHREPPPEGPAIPEEESSSESDVERGRALARAHRAEQPDPADRFSVFKPIGGV